MKKQKIYSRWQFEPKDYQVIRHEEVTEGEKKEAADLLSSIISSTECSSQYEVRSSKTERVDIIQSPHLRTVICRRFSHQTGKPGSRARLASRKGTRRTAVPAD